MMEGQLGQDSSKRRGKGTEAVNGLVCVNCCWGEWEMVISQPLGVRGPFGPSGSISVDDVVRRAVRACWLEEVTVAAGSKPGSRDCCTDGR